MRILLFFIVFICLSVANQPTKAQEPKREISAKKLAEWQADEDFYYPKQNEQVAPARSSFVKWLNRLIQNLGFKNKINWDYVLYTSAFLVLLFLIYYLTKGNRTAAFSDSGASLTLFGVEDRSETKRTLQEQWIEAEEEQDLSLALRLMALMAFKNGNMQAFFGNDEIVTPAQIVRKISNHQVYSPLVPLFQTIEFVYYGAFPLQASLYQELKLVYLQTFEKQEVATT